MDLDIPPYEGKPTAYLDQNILDMMRKYGVKGFVDAFLKDCQVIYSDETLKEIKRSGDRHVEFLDVLRSLDAYHIKIILEQPGFKITDDAFISYRGVDEIYQEFCENDPEYGSFLNTMNQFMFKFSGGRKGDSISQIHDEQRIAFDGLLDNMKSKTAQLASEYPELNTQIDTIAREQSSQFDEALSKTESLILDDIPDDTQWSGITTFRTEVDLGPVELNNITEPDVLQKIWERYRIHPAYKNIDIEQFFGININPDQPLYRFQKVVSIYSILNTIGYHPDSKVHKEKRFIAAQSDMQHASMGLFCNFLLSADTAFIKKVRATYEYLDIECTAIYVNLIKE